jgi:hypothetical protein
MRMIQSALASVSVAQLIMPVRQFITHHLRSYITVRPQCITVVTMMGIMDLALLSVITSHDVTGVITTMAIVTAGADMMAGATAIN